MELMARATSRGEHFSAVVGQADFIAAVGVLTTHLGVSLPLPQAEKLFQAVSGGGPSVQFEDFIEAPSTHYYLRELHAGPASGRAQQDLDSVEA